MRAEIKRRRRHGAGVVEWHAEFDQRALRGIQIFVAVHAELRARVVRVIVERIGRKIAGVVGARVARGDRCTAARPIGRRGWRRALPGCTLIAPGTGRRGEQARTWRRRTARRLRPCRQSGPTRSLAFAGRRVRSGTSWARNTIARAMPRRAEHCNTAVAPTTGRSPQSPAATGGGAKTGEPAAAASVGDDVGMLAAD